MPDILAKVMTVITGLLLVFVVAVLYVTSRPPSGTKEVVAEFRNVFPLIEGMAVRVEGAIAGSVGPIEVTDEGLAEVTLLLEDTIEEPTANATASIRQQDTTGDSYLAYDPGDAKEGLGEVDGTPTIECKAKSATDPCKNTLVAPRFDDLLNSFGPPERAGIQLMLTELAHAVDERGDDLNRAALELRPALVAAGQAFDEVNQQNAALRSLIADASAVTGEAASRRDELDRLISSLETTLEATTAESDSLDAGLQRLPATLSSARSTLAALTNAAVAARPLAEELAAGAPDLATALRTAVPFTDDVEALMDRSTPTLELVRELARAGAPTIYADPQRVVTGPFDLAPALSNLFKGILGGDTTFDAFFGGPVSNRGFGAIAVEPGGQAGYPPGYDRNFLRISALINCEVFGVPVGPGCLGDVLAGYRNRSAAGGRLDLGGPAATPDPGGNAPAAPGGNAVKDVLDDLGVDNALDELNKNLNDVLDDLGVKGAVDGLNQNLNDTLDGLNENLGDPLGALGRKQRSILRGSAKSSRDLLDFLLD